MPPAITRSTGTRTTAAEADRPPMRTPAPKRQARNSHREPVLDIPARVNRLGVTREKWNRELEAWGSWHWAISQMDPTNPPLDFGVCKKEAEACTKDIVQIPKEM